MKAEDFIEKIKTSNFTTQSASIEIDEGIIGKKTTRNGVLEKSQISSRIPNLYITEPLIAQLHLSTDFFSGSGVAIHNQDLRWVMEGTTGESTEKPVGDGTEGYDGAEMVTSVSKEVLDARLEAIEARMDARVAGMSAKLDANLAEIRADRGRFSQLESDLREVKGELKSLPAQVDAKLRDSATDTRTQIASMKANIWAGVATTVGAIIATFALSFAAFDSGREMSKNISEATARMEKIQTQLDAAAKALPATPQASQVKP